MDYIIINKLYFLIQIQPHCISWIIIAGNKFSQNLMA